MPSLARAQNFDCGSDGSYGPLNVTSNTTLTLPADGIFKCTTIFIGTNATLTFTRNALNTPVYLLATGNVTVNGTIDVSGSPGAAISGGSGGPGGFDGGNPGGGINVAAAGFGPGAGQPNGAGGYATSYSAVPPNGPTYGSVLLIPLVGGSGGGGINLKGGAGGGGAVLLASNIRIDVNATGTISANGGGSSVSTAGIGSGGGIRLVSPVIAGTGALLAEGGRYFPNNSIYAGAGRIRIDAIDKRSVSFSYGVSTVSGGAAMFVFPSPLPRLDIIEAAGTLIPVGNPSSVSILLPFGSTTNRTVTIRAQDFNSVLPISVVLTPDQGNSITFTNTIDNLTANPATNAVSVVVPVNVLVKINAWTR
jgi:hypothetical protein